MNYNLKNKEDRRRYVRYCNKLLDEQRPNVKVLDESGRTPNQNSYMHVIIRIVAVYTGETEYYAKQVYFKQMANPGIFKRVTKDSVTGKITETYRSSKELSIPEMRKAIGRFKQWVLEVFEGKLILPDATIEDDGTVTFKSDAEKDGFARAEIEASKVDNYM